MKAIYKISFASKFILSMILAFLCAFNMQAQEKHRTYLKLNYLKNSQNKKFLTAELKTKINKKFYTVQDATITFNIAGDSAKVLGEEKTDKDGIAKLEVKDPPVGMVIYMVEYEGRDTLRARESEVEVKDISMTMELEIIDSVKTITVKTEAEKDPETGKDISEGVDIEFFVQRMFSLLPVGKESIEDGECSIEFPNDLPGDSAGSLIIYAKIVDHDDFANIEQMAELDWGIPVTLVEEDYNPFLAGKYIGFMIISILIVIGVVFVVNKLMKKRIDT